MKIVADKFFSAFTLIELVISVALASVILVASYMCLNSALASQKLIEPRVDMLQSARVVMSLMSADLRSACPLSKDTPFLGMQRKIGEMQADNLDFGTHHYSPKNPNEGDFCQTSYFVEKDAKTGQCVLWRRRNPTIAEDPLNGGNYEEIARGVRGLRCEYYDGYDWYETWGDVDGKNKAATSNRDQPNLEGMPEAVRITLWLDARPTPKKSARKSLEESSAVEVATDTNEPPLMFQTVARLNLSAISSKNSGSTGSSGTDNNASGTPGAQNGAPNQ